MSRESVQSYKRTLNLLGLGTSHLSPQNAQANAWKPNMKSRQEQSSHARIGHTKRSNIKCLFGIRYDFCSLMISGPLFDRDSAPRYPTRWILSDKSLIYELNRPITGYSPSGGANFPIRLSDCITIVWKRKQDRRCRPAVYDTCNACRRSNFCP